jgi:uncharacterized membrane protein YeaQ/YmgE (transglycosylase-associated protein family)
MALSGLLSWLLAGLVSGALFRLASRRLLAGVGIERGWPGCLLLGSGGALLGGLLATLLGFGGLAAYDPRSLTLAALGGLFVPLLDRWLGSLT